MSEKPETTNSAFIDQVKKYVNAGWPIEPLNCFNLFEDRDEIDKWLATIPEHLRNRLQDNRNFHPIKLLMLLDPKMFWTEEKIASQNWSRGIGFRTGLTLTYSESYPGKVQLPIAIDGDNTNPHLVKTLEHVISQYNLQDFVPIQNTPHGGLHILLCAYVDPNNLEEIELWEKKKSLTEGAGAWLNGAKCAIKINCQQVTLFPTLHRKDGSSYKLNKVIPLSNTTWVLDKIVEAFISDGLLECSPEEYHAKLEEKVKADSACVSYKEFDSSEWFDLTEDEIGKTANLILGTDGEEFGPIYCFGNRHNNTMAIAGACAWSHISQDATERLFKVLIDRTKDEEPEDRFKVIKETYQRIQNQQTVQGRNIMIELFRVAHKSRDISAATNRFEQFRQALGLSHKKIRKNLTVTGFLKANHGDYVRVHDIMISGIQEMEKMITKIETTCLSCNTKDQIKAYNRRPYFAWEAERVIKRATSHKCPSCNETESDVSCEEINSVQVEVQDCNLADDMQQSARVVLLNDACNDVRNNEEAVITGFINTITIKGKRVPVLFAGNVNDEGSGITYTNSRNQFNTLTIEEEEECAKYQKEQGENILADLANKFNISVLGNEYEKQGIILACNNAAKDSVLRRTRINVFLVGDPGLAKTQMLRGATEIVPRSRFISATTTSVKTAVGVVIRDSSGAEITRSGAIVKASGAVCAYDEIGSLSFEEQKYLLNAVQEGRIPLGKYGLQKDLNGSATFIFSANPTGGSGRWAGGDYYKDKDKTGQIPVLGALLDRIDLVFIMNTNRDETYLHDYANKKLRLHEHYEEIRKQEQSNHLFISKFLLYCKRFNPKLSEDVLLMLEKFYVDIAKVAESKSSPRLLDSLHNMTVSLARLKGKDIADTADADQVMGFFQRQYENRLALKVMIPKEPLEVVKEIIIKRIEGFDGWYYLKELLTNLYNEEQDVKDYFGIDKKLVLDRGKNKKFRLIAEWVEGDPRIKLLDRGKLKITCEASYKDSRGGKREGSGRPAVVAVPAVRKEEGEAEEGEEDTSLQQQPNNQKESNNASEIIKATLNLTSINQSHAQSDLTDLNGQKNFGNVLEPEKNCTNSKIARSGGQIEHDFDYSTEECSSARFPLQTHIQHEVTSELLRTATIDQLPLSPSSAATVARPVSINPVAKSIPSNLIDQVPELAKLVCFDMEWTQKGQDIYCFCAIDIQGNKKEALHISEFGNSQYDFMVAILEVLTRYKAVVGYNILQEKSNYRTDSLDSDWATLRNNCAKVGLLEQFEGLQANVKLLDLYQVFKNNAIKSALQAVDIRYRGRSLAAVSAAYINQTKFEGLAGTDIEFLEPSKQLEYCSRDVELCLMLMSKNNYEILELIYNVSQDIKTNFFDTANAWGPTDWWRDKLNAEEYPKFHTDYDWIQSQTFVNKEEGGKTGTLFKFEGGYVRDPVAGIHRNVKTYDFVSMYPSVCIQYKISSETINCSCCKYDKDALIPQQVQDEVDSSSKGSRNWKHYWICKKKESGKLSEIMGKLMKEKDQFKEKGLIFPSKAKKLIMNSGYGAFGYVKFAYFDPRVCELITAYSRYIIKEISKLLVNSDQNSKVIYGDTDSIFVTGGDSIDIIAEAKNRFGVRFELDKVWKILFLFNEKKQYFGMTADGKLETKTLTGLKDDKTKFCNMATSHLIRKDLLEMFIEKPKEALRQAVKYTRSIFHELEDRLRNGDLDFIINQLSLTELASKALYDYSSDDWHTRAYNEILEDCNGDEELAKKKSQGEKEYTYWKILQLDHTKTKTGKESVKKKETTTIHPEKHVQDINIKKYKAELWTSVGPILMVYGLGKNELELLKKEL